MSEDISGKISKVKKAIGFIITGLVGAAVAFGVVKSDDIKSALKKGEEKSIEVQAVMYKADGLIKTIEKEKSAVKKTK